MPKSSMASMLALATAAMTAAPAHPQATAPEPVAVAAEPTLPQVDGSLRHVFTVSFIADAATLATVRGLSGMGVAVTAAGGEIQVAWPPGVPHPRGTAAVAIREVPDPRNRTAMDHLAPPPGIPQRQGHELVTSHRMAIRDNLYLIVWRDRSAGEYSVTQFDTDRPQAPQPTITRSRAAIIGVARSPAKPAADYYLTFWIMPPSRVGPESKAQVLVESYVWQPPA